MDIKSTSKKTRKTISLKDPSNYDNWNLIHSKIVNSALEKIGAKGSIKFGGEVKISEVGDAKTADLIVAIAESISENLVDGDSFTIINTQNNKDTHIDGREIDISNISSRGETTRHPIGHINNGENTLDITLTTSHRKHIISDLIMASFEVKAKAI